ncbi:MAG TPA: Asp-tRNA(Asn)/Glu-tRNA(Gln) amidotransferase subunit GatA [Polyangiaceae bacterium]|nr:Asp-tRNA(Asn)/Glu-tRNA(Gln) amidotransferase subunit GatA [Polyangiaceae bacterium]
MNSWLARPISDIVAAVTRGDISAEEMARASVAAIEKKNPSLGAFLTVSADMALEQARAVDAKRARGDKLGKLAGVPIALKDALCTRGVATTCASKILTRGERGWQPPYDATVVARLKAADAVLPGKANMDEFAMGSSNENSAFFPCKNPWDRSRSPGGSSGGSAVAVAAAMTSGALGSDTGGSIRQPAAFTSVVGVKPTYGRVSRFGLVAFASSLDQIGPFAADVRGAARVLEAIAGHDENDATSLTDTVGAYESACDKSPRGIRIGVPEQYFAEGLDADVAISVRAAIEELGRAGCAIVPITLPHTAYAVATYYILATAEASSNLARFDGVRFGLRVEGARATLADMYGQTRDAGFGDEVKRRIMLGTYVLSAGYYDAFYLKAQRVRTLIRRDFERAFAEVDVIATPTSPVPPFRLGERTSDPLSMYLADVYTLPASLAGLPALSLPCAPTPARDDRPLLPVGLQLMAAPLDEERLFTVAAALEKIFPARSLPPGD